MTAKSPNIHGSKSVLPGSEALSLDMFCGEYNVGKTYAYEQIKEGRLKARKAGKRTLILKTDAQAWAASLPLMAGAA